MKLILASLIVLLTASIAKAELYLVIDKTSKEVITASEKNDSILKETQQLVVLPGGFTNYPLMQPITSYKYDKKFILNQAKIDAEQKKIDDISALNLKKAKDRKSALDKLKVLANLTEDEVNAL